MPFTINHGYPTNWGELSAQLIAQGGAQRARMQMEAAQAQANALQQGFGAIADRLTEDRRARQREQERDEDRQWQQEQWDRTHPIQAELNRLDQAELAIQTDPSWGPVELGTDGPIAYDAGRTTERQQALQQIETKRQALYDMMQRSSARSRQSYGTPTFATDPRGNTYGYVPGSSSFQYSPGQGSPGEVTPTREAIIREKAMQKASEEAADRTIDGDFVNTRAQQWQDYYLNGTPLPPPPEKHGLLSTVKGWFSSGQQEQATGSQPQPLPPVPSRDEFVISTGVMDGNSEAAMDNLYSMLFEQNVSPDDPRASQIIDSMPLPIQKNIARMLQASGKL